MEPACLVIADADKIHEYVFSPRELKLIRGGSAIQTQLNESVLLAALANFGQGNLADGEIADSPTVEGGSPWEVVFAGGGTVMCHFARRSEAEAYCRLVQRQFREKTRAASVSTCMTDWDGTFRTTLERALARLESQKSGPRRRLFSGHTPYWKTCEACGVSAAAAFEEGHCPACRLRLLASRASSYFQKINQKAGGALREPEDFEAIAGSDGYLGLVYIDGDGVGKYLKEVGGDSKREYRQLSREIRLSMERGVLDTCAAIGARMGRGKPVPFEVLLMGGDDAIVMLAARHAADLLVGFADRYRVRDGTFSASIVWAHHHYPIAQFLEQAEGLLRSAKRRTGNSVDYRVISEAMAVAEPERATDPSTMKPHSIEELNDLRATVLHWKKAGVPSNKVQALYRIAFETEHQATLDYFFLLAHLSDGQKAAVRRTFPFGIWDRATRKTKAADLVELWDFVGETDGRDTVDAVSAV